MTYKMTITSGGGTEEDGGDFEIKETQKTITFNCVRQPFFPNRMSGNRPLKINKYYRDGKEAWREIDHKFLTSTSYANNGHVARYWDNGSITIYPDQCGIPHFLEPLIHAHSESVGA